MSQNKNETPSNTAHAEGEKLYFESMKHLTTLSTGSILLLVTMMEKLFHSPRWRALIVSSLISFGVSILCSVSSMLQSANSVKWHGDFPKIEASMKDLMYYLALVTFLLGIIGLILFAMKNFFQ